MKPAIRTWVALSLFWIALGLAVLQGLMGFWIWPGVLGLSGLLALAGSFLWLTTPAPAPEAGPPGAELSPEAPNPGLAAEGPKSFLETSLEVCAPEWDQTPTWKHETQVYDHVLTQLFQSIVSYMNSITEPISANLLNIKTSMKDFLFQVHKNDEEILNHVALDRVTNAVAGLKSDMGRVEDQSRRTFSVFAREFDRLQDLLKNILQLTSHIAEIAERVHVLSINASIESARAGIHGKGFKVIAGEIQTLARETQELLQGIGSTADTSRDIFKSIDTEIQKGRGDLGKILSQEKETFGLLENHLKHQHEQFQDLYQGILKFVSGFEGEMEAIFPLAMLHAIIVQEVENLQGVSKEFIALMQELFSTPEGACRDFDAAETIQRVRSHLTTSRELDALETAVKALGLQDRVDLKRSKDQDYEFF